MPSASAADAESAPESEPGSAGHVDLAAIQGLIAFRRPAPYWGSQVLVHIDSAENGRRALAKLLPHVDSAADWAAGKRDVTVAVALTHAGLAALGVPQASLDSFPVQLREGMAGRAAHLGDVGESAPAHWEPPFGNGRIHVLVSVTAATEELWRERVATVLARVDEPGVTVLETHDVAALPGTRTTFGYRDGVSFPRIAGLPPQPTTAPEREIATGEFLLGFPGETGVPLAQPVPDVLGRGGSYVGIRKIHTRVAAFRSFLAANSADPESEELLAAKMLGRWRSGAPLILAPTADDAVLAADPARVNDFGYADDPAGRVCPHGAHIRRVNPRDSELAQLSDVRLHRILRYGAVYGDPLPEGVLEDDGADRGLYFMFISARPQALEFIKSEWINDGGPFDLGDEQDPVAGGGGGDRTYTIPRHPVRRRLHGVEPFTVTKGGEYAFLPSLPALRWLSEPRSSGDRRREPTAAADDATHSGERTSN